MAPEPVRTDKMLRAQGQRVTPQRLFVADVLASNREHLTANEIYARIKDKFPSVDISTIYRILELYVRLGLASRLDAPDGASVYEWCPEHAGHHHLFCERCGAVLHLEGAELHDAIRRECLAAGFLPNAISLAVTGLCEGCRPAN